MLTLLTHLELGEVQYLRLLPQINVTCTLSFHKVGGISVCTFLFTCKFCSVLAGTSAAPNRTINMHIGHDIKWLSIWGKIFDLLMVVSWSASFLRLVVRSVSYVDVFLIYPNNLVICMISWCLVNVLLVHMQTPPALLAEHDVVIAAILNKWVLLVVLNSQQFSTLCQKKLLDSSNYAYWFPDVKLSKGNMCLTYRLWQIALELQLWTYQISYWV